MCPKRDNRSAFTLIEVILALTLGTIVITLAGESAIQSLRTERAVQGDIVRQSVLDHVFEMLRADLDQRLDVPMTIELDPNHRPTFEFAGLVATDGNTVWRRRLPSAVRYRLRRNDDNSLTLVRAVTDLTKENAFPNEQSVISRITLFEIEAFQRQRWRGPADLDEEAEEEITAIRVTCQTSEIDAPRTRVFIITEPERDES